MYNLHKVKYRGLSILFDEFWQMNTPVDIPINREHVLPPGLPHCQKRGLGDFYHYWLIPSVLELHINELMQYALFGVLLLSVNIMFLRCIHYGCRTTFHGMNLFIHSLLMDIAFVSSFELIWTKLLCTFLHKFVGVSRGVHFSRLST